MLILTLAGCVAALVVAAACGAGSAHGGDYTAAALGLNL